MRAARIGKMRNAYQVWSEYLKGRDHMEDLDIDGKILYESWINKV
jgi:hypothetical protein